MRKTLKKILAAATAAAMLPITALTPAIASAVDTADVDVTVRLDPSDASPFNDGRFQGWGTSIGWWANRIGYNETMAQQAADLFYSEDGLSLDIVRYNVGGGDDPDHNHITRSDSKLPCFLDEDGNYDWDADYNQVNVLTKIKAANDDVHIEGYTNSPPWFMTVSGCSSGGVNASENLDEENYDEFASFLADVAEHFEALGLKFDSYSPMNEPSTQTSYWGYGSYKQEGNHVAPGDHQSGLILAVANEFAERGIDTLVVGPEETSIDYSITSYNALSDEAKAALGRIDSHSYGGSNFSGLKQTAIDAGKNLWMSEVDNGGTAGTNAGEMAAGLNLANFILRDVNGMQPSAWVMWDIIDMHKDSSFYYTTSDGEEVYSEKDTTLSQTGGIWGVGMANHDEENIELTQKYYVYGQFSRYINPGDTIIASSSKTLAAYNKDTGAIKIVAVNTDGSDLDYEFDMSAFTETGSTAKVIRTSGTYADGEHWDEVDNVAVTDGVFDYTLLANSVTTFVIDNDIDNIGYVSITGDDMVTFGDTYQYTAETSDGSDVTWSTSDDSIATIDANGVLTVVNTGTVEVQATSATLGYTASYTVTVTDLTKLEPVSVTGSASWNNTASTAYTYAVDGNVSTYFDGVTNGYVTLDLGNEYTIGAFGYAPRSGYEYRMIDGYFEGSTDGETWTTLYTITAKPTAGEITYAYDIADTENKYRYIRYTVPSSEYTQSYNGKSEAYNCNVAEIEVWATGLQKAFASVLNTISQPTEVYGNLYMPSAVDDVTIEWTSSNTDVITTTGEVMRQATDTAVTLTAVLTSGSETMEATYNVTVMAAAEGKTEDDMSAYLFVHFVGTESSEEQEQVYFSVSTDGTTWTTINDGAPILTSTVGEGGVRDPHIIRSPEGDKFFIVATDLSIYNRRGDSNRWSTCQTSGSRSIVVWESTDLVNWSEASLVEVMPEGTGCVWAPESIYDDATGSYMVFWASKISDDSYSKQRIYRSYTRDFKTFTDPEVYIDGESTSIDTTFIKNDGVYYRFTKDESQSSVIMEQSTSLDGDFAAVDTYTINGVAGDTVTGYEGPTAYKLNGEDKWCLLLDYYSKSQGYKPFVTDDISTGIFTSAADFSFDTTYRHGTVMPITSEEYKALIEAYTEEEIPEDGDIIFDLDFDNEDLTANVGAADCSTEITYTDGVKGSAAVLDADAISITNEDGTSLLTGLDKFTVSFWSKTTGSTSWWFYASPDDSSQTYKSEKYVGILDDGAKITAERYNSSSQDRPSAATGSYTSGEWKYVAVVYREGKYTLYINGKAVSTVSSEVDISDLLGDSSICYIGKANWGSGEYAVGTVDEFKIYNYALTADEVAREYGSIWFESTSLDGTTLTYTVGGMNLTDEDAIYTALYDADGVLTDVSIGTSGEYILPANGTYTIAAYRWDADMVPVSDPARETVVCE